MANNDDYDLDLPEVEDEDVLMFEGMPVTSQSFKITGVAGSVDPRNQFNLAGLPSKTRVKGTFEAVVTDITHVKAKSADEMTRVHHMQIDDNGFVRITRLVKE